MKIKSPLLWTLALSGLAVPLCSSAHAQVTPAPTIGTRLSVVELRDTTLADALELIFQAAGNPSHIIDEQAQTVPIPSVMLNNIAWDAAVRNLTQLNGYKVSRNASGTYIVEPRVVTPADGGLPGSEGMPFGSGGSPFPGAGPSNPFGSGGRGQGMGRGAGGGGRTITNQQTRPNVGGGRGAGGTNPLNPNEGKDYKIIIVRHIYAGGLAQLFAQSSVIKTEDFVSPGQTSSSGGGQGGRGGTGRSGGLGSGGGLSGGGLSGGGLSGGGLSGGGGSIGGSSGGFGGGSAF